MKVKKLVIPKYLFRDELGDFLFQNVEVLVPADSQVTPESFNQSSDDFFMPSNETERMNREAARRFFVDTYQSLQRGQRTLSSKELNGIRLFMDINGSEMSRLLCVDKSTVSRILSGKQTLQGETAVLVIEKLKNELEAPGSTKAVLKTLDDSNIQIRELNISASIVAEWFIRKFSELDECITSLKLQKLLYYAQGVAVGRYRCRLLAEDFHAWEHGPVVPSVYQLYKYNGATPLSINPSMDVRSIADNQEVVAVLNDTMNLYGKFAAWVLREKSHCESPWVETPQSQVISFDKIRDFFVKTL